MLKLGLRFLLTTAVLVVGVVGCCGAIVWKTPPAPPCDIETLIVQEGLFPEGWQRLGEPRAEDAPSLLGVEKIGTAFSTPARGGAIQDVYRTFDTRAAVSGYEKLLSHFSVRSEETEWTLPEALDYHGSTADQFRLGCSTWLPTNVESCQFLGQYGVYLVRFHTLMSPDMMTYEDLEHILQDIDRRMAECLNA